MPTVVQAVVTSAGTPSVRAEVSSRILLVTSRGYNLQQNRVLFRSNIVRTESHAFYPGLGYALIKTQHVYRKALTPTSAPPA